MPILPSSGADIVRQIKADAQSKIAQGLSQNGPKPNNVFGAIQARLDRPIAFTRPNESGGGGVTCPSITLSDIATLVSTTYTLNANTTILACQTLEILAGYSLNTGANRLKNYGTINIVATSSLLASSSPSSFIENMNMGRINIQLSGVLATLTQGTIKNQGIIINNGTLWNNNSTIYNYNNGVITNNLTYRNEGDLFNADGSGLCGIGILNGTSPITETGITCPP